MLSSPLRLNAYFLKELHFSLSSIPEDTAPREIDFDKIELQIEVDTSRYKKNPLEWKCEIHISSRDDAKANLPYKFRIAYVGFFEISDQYPSEKVELLAKTNAPALLYSAARETLLSLTSRGPVPPLLLPSVTFIEPPLGASALAKAGKKKSRKETSS